MNHPVLLVPHQEIYLQSWRNFPEIRWHMLVTGFGGGKTRANVILTLMLVRELQGMKDRAGDGARLIVAGYTLAHLEKTFLLYFRSYLNTSKTEYREDTKNHIVYIGTVTIIFLPMENPDNLFGEDAVACFNEFTKVLTRRQKRNILEVCIKDVREGDEVLTRRGWKKVLAVHDNGWKDCINVRGIWVTPDHRYAVGDGWTEAQDIEDSTPLYKYSLSEVKAWQDVILGRNLLLQMSRNLMESGTIDTRILPAATNAIITGARSIRHITWLCGKRPTENCLKDTASIIRTSTALITASTICSCLQYLNTTAFMPSDSRSREYTGLKREEKLCLNTLRSLLQNEDVRKLVPGAENSMSETSSLNTVLSSAATVLAEINRRLREQNTNLSEPVNIVEKSTGLSAPAPDSAARCVMMLTNMHMDSPPLRSESVEFVLSAEKSSSAQKGLPHRHAHRTARTSREVKRCHVYDLTVEDCHEYFAGRYLVHNCIQEESDELPEATLMEACKALSERTRQQIIGFRSPFICLGTTSQGESGLYRLYCQFKKKGTGFVLIRGRTQDNFYLPKEQIVDLYKMYDDVERRVFLEGEFLAVSRNRVFPGFSWDRNYIDDDMDKYTRPGERVYIGQDVNCIGGDVLIETLRGRVPMRDVTTDDKVLTRKGYKQVLTKMHKGVKIIREYGGVTATPDHVAITPEGDMTICQAKNLYCLKEQYTSDLEPIRHMTELISLLKWWLSMESSGEGTLQRKVQEGIISQDMELCCTDEYMKNSSGPYLKGCRYTTSTGAMTTDLRILSCCLQQSIQHCIRRCLKDASEGNRGRVLRRLKRLWLTMLRKLEKSSTQGQERKTGSPAPLSVQLCALTAEKSSQRTYQLLRDVLSAGKNTGEHSSGRAITIRRKELRHLTRTVLTEFVPSVESMLSEAARLSIARNIDIIGNVQGMSERSEEVFDIEVEGAHEFFANGVLVHNCGFSRASAWVARGPVLHCLKRYDFPDIADAPDIFRYDFPDAEIFWIPDVTTKDSYPQFARALRRNNIHIIHRSKNPIVEDTAFLVSVLCKNSRIIFHKMARDTADAVARAVRDKEGKIGKGKAPSDWQHDADTVRYAVSYMALVLPDFRDIRQSLITHIASLRREVERDETPSVRKLSAGYTQIDPEAFFKK